jgi:hypothetical protein
MNLRVITALIPGIGNDGYPRALSLTQRRKLTTNCFAKTNTSALV